MIIVLILLIIAYILVIRDNEVKEYREEALKITRAKARKAAADGERWDHYFDKLASYPSWLKMVLWLPWRKFEDFYPDIDTDISYKDFMKNEKRC